MRFDLGVITDAELDLTIADDSIEQSSGVVPPPPPPPPKTSKPDKKKRELDVPSAAEDLQCSDVATGNGVSIEENKTVPSLHIPKQIRVRDPEWRRVYGEGTHECPMVMIDNPAYSKVLIL